MHARKKETHMSNEERLAILETTILNISTQLTDIRHQFDKIDLRFDAMDRKFETMDRKFESKFDAINNRLWSNFLWLAGMIAGLAGLIAHTQHWI